jgi:hypothetical protein
MKIFGSMYDAKVVDISARNDVNAEEVKLINKVYYPVFLLDR